MYDRLIQKKRMFGPLGSYIITDADKSVDNIMSKMSAKSPTIDTTRYMNERYGVASDVANSYNPSKYITGYKSDISPYTTRFNRDVDNSISGLKSYYSGLSGDAYNKATNVMGNTKTYADKRIKNTLAQSNKVSNTYWSKLHRTVNQSDRKFNTFFRMLKARNDINTKELKSDYKEDLTNIYNQGLKGFYSKYSKKSDSITRGLRSEYSKIDKDINNLIREGTTKISDIFNISNKKEQKYANKIENILNTFIANSPDIKGLTEAYRNLRLSSKYVVNGKNSFRDLVNLKMQMNAIKDEIANRAEIYKTQALMGSDAIKGLASIFSSFEGASSDLAKTMGGIYTKGIGSKQAVGQQLLASMGKQYDVLSSLANAEGGIRQQYIKTAGSGLSSYYNNAMKNSNTLDLQALSSYGGLLTQGVQSAGNLASTGLRSQVGGLFDIAGKDILGQYDLASKTISGAYNLAGEQSRGMASTYNAGLQSKAALYNSAIKGLGNLYHSGLISEADMKKALVNMNNEMMKAHSKEKIQQAVNDTQLEAIRRTALGNLALRVLGKGVTGRGSTITPYQEKLLGLKGKELELAAAKQKGLFDIENKKLGLTDKRYEDLYNIEDRRLDLAAAKQQGTFNLENKKLGLTENRYKDLYNIENRRLGIAESKQELINQLYDNYMENQRSRNELYNKYVIPTLTGANNANNAFNIDALKKFFK